MVETTTAVTISDLIEDINNETQTYNNSQISEGEEIFSNLNKFCGSRFWDQNLTWNTEDPEFTPCFEKTVLVWIPCLFLWAFAFLEVFYIYNSKRRNIPWNWLNLLKIGITATLIVLTVSDIVTSYKTAVSKESFVNDVDIYSPLLKIFTFILSGVFVIYNRKYGLQTSGLLFFFWFFLAIFGIPQFRSEIRRGMNNNIQPDYHYFYVSYLIYYPLIIFMFLLNCLADRAPLERKYPLSQNPCPEETASFLSRLLFSWFDPLAWKGFKKPLETDDLWNINLQDSSRELVPVFEKCWQQSLKKCESTSPSQVTHAKFKSDSASVDFISSKKKKQASILPALFKCFGPIYLFGAMLKLIQDLLTFASPQILGLLISYTKFKQETWKGYFYAVLLLTTAIVQTLFLAQYFNRMFIVGMRIRTVLVSAIYKKALRISNSARKESTVGEIVNLMAVDAQKFMDLIGYLNMIWSAPLQICLSLYFLWKELGPSVLAGLAVMIILIPVNGFIANKIKKLQVKQMKNKDERVKLMNEILNGIKVLKLYAWEPSFEDQVLKIRNKEINVLKQTAYLNAGTSFIWSCAPFLVTLVTFVTYVFSDPENNILTAEKIFKSIALFAIIGMPLALLPMLLVYTVEVSLVTFATYVLVDERNILDANKAYVSISLFNIIRFPLSMLPMMLSNLVQTWVSVKRINKFMNAEELDPNNVQHEPSEEPLTIENGTFSWGDDPILKHININIRKKTLTAVVGTVGAGKSSLISAFLGEMDKVSGRVNCYGKVAYVSQQAWIQNATLRDNVLFGKSYDKTLYDQVIEACALVPDFDMLPAGDKTEIGEKGINLSGGQKQRVSLARAVYSNADVYFLDDPLSAVDSHVGKHIFEKVIGPHGLLKNKTRVLVTHGITYLPQTDKIIVLKTGEISETGTYQELLDRKGAFSEFLLQHITEEVESEAELDELKDQLGDTPLSEEVAKKLIRHRSRVSESHSDTGSDHIGNGSIQRLNSIDKSNRKMSTEKDEKRGEKLIETEKAETGNVRWSVYKHYLKSIGLLFMLATLIFNLVYQGFSVGSNVWLGVWADDSTLVMNGTVNTGRRDMYLGVYGALGLGQVLTILFASLALYVGSLNAARSLHLLILRNVLRAPCTTFFDVTPLGRILNRFSKDIDTLDNVLPMTIRGWLTCLYSVNLTIAALNAATDIHKGLLFGVLRQPMHFFDMFPIGRVLSRFSKDLLDVDTELPLNFYEVIESGFILHSIQKSTIFTNSFNLDYIIAYKKQKYLNVSALPAAVTDLAVQIGCLTAGIAMHNQMLKRVLQLPLLFFDTVPIGRILSRFSNDIEIIDDDLPWYASDGIFCLYEVIGTLAVISYTTPAFILVIIPLCIIYYFMQRFYVATSRQLKRLESVSRSPIYSHFGETVSGAHAIRAYNQQDRFIVESENKVDLNQICYYPGIISNRWLAVRLEMLGNLIIFFAALFAVIKENQSAGLVGLSVTYSLQITQTLNWLVRMTSDVETNIVAVERIKEYGEAQQEAPWKLSNEKTSSVWPEVGKVEFKNYSVRYRPGLDLVLHNINFEIKGGEKVGIVGRTGAGKSSLTLALFRIIEAAQGNILIDGVKINELGLHTLRSRLTIIPQDAVLFSGTLRINLDPFNTHNDDEVWKSLEHAHLKTFVQGLPAGLNHEVTEGGENLSVGQRQLICLARALLRKTKILILDEATAAVDLETDDLIQKTIRTEFKDCTVLTIAHRLNTIMDSDRIIVLDKGNVAEFDSPSNLLANDKSIFYSMSKDAGLA